MGMNPTVVCILIRKDDRVLGVTRRENHDDWGLPGGKLEPDEDPRAGAIRELQEETGIRVEPEGLIPVFVAQDGDWTAITYEAMAYKEEAVHQEGEGLVGWVAWEQIEQGSFGSYNRSLHETLLKRPPPGYMNGGWMMGRTVEEIEEIRDEAARTNRDMGAVAFELDRGKNLDPKDPKDLLVLSE